MIPRRAGCALALVAVLGASAAELKVVVTAERGGAKAGEVGSVQEAVEAVRWARKQGNAGPAVIELKGGRHELSGPLQLGAEDSQLTIQAAPGALPVLAGGTRLTGWQRCPTNASLWELILPEVRDGRWYFRQLFAQGRRQPRARTPNEGFFRATGRLGTNSPIALPFRAGDLLPEWADRPEAELILLMKWTDIHVPLLEVNSVKGVARFPGGPRPDWMDEPDARYWIENVVEALDAPGEWCLERASGRLLWRPPEGLDPNTALVTAPRLVDLVRIKGDVSIGAAVRELRFVGITFAEADYSLPERGMISPQAAVPVTGAFRATHAVDCALEDCRFELCGGYAVELGRGCQRWTVVGNEIRELGGGGIRLGEPGDRQPLAFDANHSHRVTDNTLVGLGRVFSPAVGVIIFQSGTNRIAHNYIADLFYTGISVGWNWGYQDSPCQANVIEHNLVERVGQGRLSDMGGIYTLGPQPGTIIRNNVFRDVQSHDYGGWGLYTDEGSTGILIENNVASGCKSAGFHQHYGRDNVVRNNLLAFNQEHELMRSRDEPHRSFWFTNNVVVWDSGDLLGSTWKGTTNQFLLNGNLYFDFRLGTNAAGYRFAGETLVEWRAHGQDRNSVIADPELMDRQRPELGFRPKSPALAVGFRPERLQPLGPRPPGQRN